MDTRTSIPSYGSESALLPQGSQKGWIGRLEMGRVEVVSAHLLQPRLPLRWRQQFKPQKDDAGREQSGCSQDCEALMKSAPRIAPSAPSAGSFQALDWPKEGRGVLDLKTLSLLINIHFTKVTFIITLWDCYYDLNEQLSLRATIIECVCCSYWAHTSRACALQQEKPPQWKPCAPKWRVVPTHCN